MKKWIFIFNILFFFSTTIITSQSSFYISNKKIKDNESFLFKEFLENELKSNSNKYSIVLIEPNIRINSSKVIEGISSKQLSKTELEILISNIITKQDTTITFNYNINSENESDTNHKTFVEFLKNSNHKAKTIFIITKFINISKSICDDYNKLLNEKSKNFDIQTAVQTIAYLNLNNICQSNSDLQEQILDKYRKNQCEKSLYDAKVLIATGTTYNLKKASDLLLNIPPGSKLCLSESLEVIKQLSDKTNLNMNSKQQLGQYMNIIKNNDINSWYRSIIENANNSQQYLQY